MGSDFVKTADFEAFMKQRNGRSGPTPEFARLDGPRMVLAIEADEGRELAGAAVKNLTGGDRITARHLFKEFKEFDPQFKLWFVANDLPRFDGTDSGMLRRVRVLPFDHVPPERDENLKKTLSDPAISGPAILAWMVKGCLLWQRDGLGRVPAQCRRQPRPIAGPTTPWASSSRTAASSGRHCRSPPRPCVWITSPGARRTGSGR